MYKRQVFGDYIDIYDMTQAVEDGATRPVYYESRVIHLKLDEKTLHLIDDEYDLMAANADPYVIEKSKKELGQMEAILGACLLYTSLEFAQSTPTQIPANAGNLSHR